MPWMRWFPGTQEFWELYLLPEIANRHICTRAQGSLWLQACKAAYLFVWSQAEEEHTRPYMAQDAELLSLQSIQTGHHQQLHSQENHPLLL